MNLKKIIVWLLSISIICQSSMQVYPVKAIPDVILNPLYFEFANFFASKIPSVKEQSNLIASQTGVHSVNELPSCVSGQKTKIYFPLINNRNRIIVRMSVLICLIDMHLTINIIMKIKINTKINQQKEMEMKMIIIIILNLKIKK